MAWRIVRADVIQGFSEPVAEKMGPHAIHERLGQKLGADDQLRQLRAPVDVVNEAAVAFELRAIDKHGISGLRQSIAQLIEQHGLLGVVVLAREILIDELDGRHVAAFFEAPQGPRLAEKGVHLPELVLLPVVERMVVALRALDLQAQENLRGLGRGLDGVLLQAAGQEIDESVKIFFARLADASGRNQLENQPVVGYVVLQRPP